MNLEDRWRKRAHLKAEEVRMSMMKVGKMMMERGKKCSLRG